MGEHEEPSFCRKLAHEEPMREKKRRRFFCYGMQFSFISPFFSRGPLSDGCAICFVARGSPKAAKSVQFTRTSGFQYCSTFRSILSCFASFLLAHEVFFSDFTVPFLFLQQCKNFPSFFFEHIF